MFSAFEKMEFPFRNPGESKSVFPARSVSPWALSQSIKDMPYISQSLYQTFVWKAEVARDCEEALGWPCRRSNYFLDLLGSEKA